jgi:transposase
MKPIHEDVRCLIILAKAQDKTIKELSSLYFVSESTVKRVYRLHNETGTLKAKAFTGRPSRLTEEDIAIIIKKIELEPDSTLAKIIEDLKLPIAKSQLHNILVKRGISFKKKRFTPRLNKETM